VIGHAGTPGDARQHQSDKAGQAQRHRDRLLQVTIEVWQPLSTTHLNREDARQILENMTGFFNLLLSWQAAAAADSRSNVGAEEAA
jgi:hypothetical protein